MDNYENEFSEAIKSWLSQSNFIDNIVSNELGFFEERLDTNSEYFDDKEFLLKNTCKEFFTTLFALFCEENDDPSLANKLFADETHSDFKKEFEDKFEKLILPTLSEKLLKHSEVITLIESSNLNVIDSFGEQDSLGEQDYYQRLGNEEQPPVIEIEEIEPDERGRKSKFKKYSVNYQIVIDGEIIEIEGTITALGQPKFDVDTDEIQDADSYDYWESHWEDIEEQIFQKFSEEF